MKKKKLVLDRQTIRRLSNAKLAHVIGGTDINSGGETSGAGNTTQGGPTKPMCGFGEETVTGTGESD